MIDGFLYLSGLYFFKNSSSSIDSGLYISSCHSKCV
ncbi:hypothetical protein [Butyrivibrio fibrisolvens]